MAIAVKKLGLLLSGIGLVCLLLLGVYNYQVDRWGVFSSDYRSFYPGLQINYRYVKTRYIFDQMDRYNCFVFGSSRVTGIDVRRLGEEVGQNCYNFSHSGATPSQHLYDIELLLEKGVRPSTIYIGVDDHAYTWDNARHEGHYRRQAYPRGLSGWLRFLGMYLFRLPDASDRQLYASGYERSDQPWWVLGLASTSFAESRDAATTLFDNAGPHLEEFSKLGPTLWYQDDHIDSTISDLGKILALGAKYDIAIEIFINPIHYKTYLANDWEMLQRFKQSLSEITDFHDFSGFNDVTLDDRYWMETSHYSVLAGDRMIDVLAGRNTAPDAFGRRLSSALLEDRYREDVQLAAALFPSILRQQSGIYLPAPVAATFTSAATYQGLLGETSLSVDRESDLDAVAEGFRLTAHGRDPQLLMNAEQLAANEFAIVAIDFTSPGSGWAEFYWAEQGGRFGPDRRMLFRTRAGRNQLFVPLLSEQAVTGLRFDPGRRAGNYSFSELGLYRGGRMDVPQ